MLLSQLNEISTSADARKEILFTSTVKFKAVATFANHKVINGVQILRWKFLTP